MNRWRDIKSTMWLCQWTWTRERSIRQEPSMVTLYSFYIVPKSIHTGIHQVQHGQHVEIFNGVATSSSGWHGGNEIKEAARQQQPIEYNNFLNGIPSTSAA